MATIEERITDVLRTVKNRLFKSEMHSGEYKLFVENSLVQKGLVRDNRMNLERNSDIPYEERAEEIDLLDLLVNKLTTKLKVTKEMGVEFDWVYLENAPLYDTAVNDLQLYNKIFERLKERLIPQVRNKSFTQDEYYNLVKLVGEPVLAEYEVDVNEKRREHILNVSGARIAYDTTLGINVKIKSPSTEERIFTRNGLTEEQLKEIIEKAEV